MITKDLLSPCGLYCGVCGIYYASIHNDTALKEKLARAYGETPDKIACGGCRSNNVYWYCTVCSIKKCTIEKGFEGCYQCEEFPCTMVENFPVPEGKKHILRAVPRWRTLGTERWVAEEKILFSCKSCGAEIFRGAKKCRKCGTIL
jgi:predicted RNA-binding Zn-ribbon protein involved in translation (DUF1610 family)